MTSRKSRECPCHSGARYAACCEPFHLGEREPETPEALMRSRYSAYALGLGEYLVRTLTRDHPDRAAGEELLARELSHVKDRQRFLGLEIREARADGDRGEVVFHARIFERGKDRSFEERSTFRKENGAWRYASGVVAAVALATMLSLVGCKEPARPVMLTAPSASPPARTPGAITRAPVAPAEEHKSLTKKDLKFTVTKLPSTDADVDILFRGEVDAAMVAVVHKALPAGWKSHAPIGSPRGGRFLIAGSDGSSHRVMVFDASHGGKLVGTHAGDEAFFMDDGSLVLRDGKSLFSWDGVAAPLALGGPYVGLCVDKTCRPRMFVTGIDSERKHALVSLASGGFVSDDNLDALDLGTGALAPVVAHSHDVAYLGGVHFGDGAFCTYEMHVSRSPDEPAPAATLLCFDPPWTSARTMMVHPNGAMMIGQVGPLLATGDVRTLHVFDRKSSKHRSFDLPEGGGLFVALSDGRSVAIEGDDHILLVNVIDETYARLDIKPTIVIPLGPQIAGFIATGDGTASLVRYRASM